MAKYHQGFFKPLNPHKYKGKDVTNIVYRSRWELVAMSKFDKHPAVIEWSSEEHVVRYRDPTTNKVRSYYPDFVVKMRNRDGVIETKMIEVKPKSQTVPPKTQTGKPTKRYLTEVQTWGTNSAKWAAARAYCDSRGWQFEIITEKELGI